MSIGERVVEVAQIAPAHTLRNAGPPCSVISQLIEVRESPQARLEQALMNCANRLSWSRASRRPHREDKRKTRPGVPLGSEVHLDWIVAACRQQQGRVANDQHCLVRQS